MPIVINEIDKIANAREVDSDDILRPKIWILLFPLATATIFKVANAKVLVLIPPAVDAGDPPIHIKKIIKSNYFVLFVRNNSLFLILFNRNYHNFFTDH